MSKPYSYIKCKELPFFLQAKQAYRSHSFPCMNRDQRRLIHELAECYGCETQSYDYEPSKNVVATAHKYTLSLFIITIMLLQIRFLVNRWWSYKKEN